MKTALIAVDVQKDFLPGGPLGGTDSDKIITPLVDLAQEVDYVIASRDWHPKDHCSFTDEPQYEDGSWPAHCVQETGGAEIHPEIAKYADAIVSKGTDPKQEAYSAFEGEIDNTHHQTLADWLEERGVDQVIVGGLVDEFCVKATAIDAAKHGFRTSLNVHAAAALSPEGEKEAISAMRKKGVHISDRLPHGEREPTRIESLSEAFDLIAREAEDAERSELHEMDLFLRGLIARLQEYAGQHDDKFVFAFPNFSGDGIHAVEIPAAQAS